MARNILQRHSLNRPATRIHYYLLPLSPKTLFSLRILHTIRRHIRIQYAVSPRVTPLLPTLPVTPSTHNASANIRILHAYAYSVLACLLACRLACLQCHQSHHRLNANWDLLFYSCFCKSFHPAATMIDFVFSCLSFAVGRRHSYDSTDAPNLLLSWPSPLTPVQTCSLPSFPGSTQNQRTDASAERTGTGNSCQQWWKGSYTLSLADHKPNFG
ncbi:hypothetical protein LX32DRAFT_25159 [Colletotrichum zoysiae]|uniref:Uncharacterized protein n=1 Tax=Colletotrichum zoysiae TaxID=1216348 RepID=A0AAD9HRZ2_9PEZI|nr:hypothetical protein LX32DRAFT_25159 [Colletotrichum zoysiae]